MTQWTRPGRHRKPPETFEEMSPTEKQIMLCLWDSERFPLRCAEIGRRIQVSRQATIYKLKALVGYGWVNKNGHFYSAKTAKPDWFNDYVSKL